jgi:hypothetical protein
MIAAFRQASKLMRIDTEAKITTLPRPQLACWIGNGSPTQGFRPVCQQGIRQMIDYYAPEK